MVAHPVALSVDVPPGTVTGTRLAGVELAVWRGPDGRPHVWRDRCPHRGARLSLGFLRSGTLACPYHGWRFDDAGRCVLIPAHPRPAPPAGVTIETWRATDSRGILWASRHDDTDDTDDTDDAPGDAETHPVRSVTIRRSVPVVTAALAEDPFAADVEQAGGHAHAAPPGTGAVLAAVQPVADDVTALHVVHLGPASVDLLVALAERAARLRSRLESRRLPA